MALLKLTKITSGGSKITSDFISGAVVHSSAGPREPTRISSESDLRRMYPGLTYMEGYVKLIDSGSDLLLQRLIMDEASSSTLRISKDPLIPYSYPEDYSELTPRKVSIEMNPGDLDKIEKYGMMTLSYTIDLTNSEFIDRDYLVIPSAMSSNRDGKVMFFMSRDSTHQPSDEGIDPGTYNIIHRFAKWVEDKGYNINDLDIGRYRIEWLFDIMTKVSPSPDPHSDDNISDLGILLSESRKESNKITLVYRTPVSKYQFYNSRDAINPFRVYSDSSISSRLLDSQLSLVDENNDPSGSSAVLSLEARLEGDLEIDISITHVSGWRYYIREIYGDEDITHLVSLDPEDRDDSGNYLFLESVLARDSLLMNGIVHIDTNSQSSFLGTSIQRSYVISKGKRGEFSEEAYSRSIESLFSVEFDFNVFLTDIYSSTHYQKIVLPYIKSHSVVAFVTVPNSIFTDPSRDPESLLEASILKDEDREFLVYVLGEAVIKGDIIPSSFFYVAKSLGEGSEFLGYLEDEVLLPTIPETLLPILDKRRINYLSLNEVGYYIDSIEGVSRFLPPIYLIISVFVKSHLTRFMYSKLGLDPLVIFSDVKDEIITLKSYSNLISSLELLSFDSEGNNITAVIELILSGLVGRVINLEIKLTTQS